MRENWKEDFLCYVMDCGYADLSLLDDCGYDISEVIEDCKTTFGDLHINNVLYTLFQIGISREVEQRLNDRICQLEAISNERELDKEEENELESLRQLDPQSDIDSFRNCLDTHVWIEDEEKAAIYKEYIPEALDDFEFMTGFQISTE